MLLKKHRLSVAGAIQNINVIIKVIPWVFLFLYPEGGVFLSLARYKEAVSASVRRCQWASVVTIRKNK